MDTVILTEDVLNFFGGISDQKEIDTTQTAFSNDLSDTERNTMLKLIIGMAIDAYGYKPDNIRNSATGDKNGISAKLRTQGISISDDTVRKYLTEAKKLL